MKLINLLLILGIVLSLSACSVQEEIKETNTCEKFANAQDIKIIYPGNIYEFDGIRISEEDLKNECLTTSS